MKLLLDTHAFIWAKLLDPKLPDSLRAEIVSEDNEVYVSAVTCWEIAIKTSIGKLVESAPFAHRVEQAAEESWFICLPVSFRHAQRVGSLPLIHKDPFDRLLIAQALEENLILVSNESLFDAYGIQRLWQPPRTPQSPTQL